MIWNYKKRKPPPDYIGLKETVYSVSISLLMLLFITGLVLREGMNEGQKARKVRRTN